ncbi:serine/threonine-protein phosphatase 7 long form-like protein [Senna tora]|uniref:Serine/threonine-protein phosphatase 7 long form-like protein n=1 Tax=Senna tora TaxID=362788 RepID=A0A834SPA3_9FABA|nr:serine/threonine-protein phosphatase 7 long form-like protein [Senna tora]
MAMRVRGFLYKNGSCLSGNDGLSFQADRVEGVMLTDDMTLAQLKESIRGRLRMGRGEEICNVTYRMPMTLCPLRFGELNLCDDYSVAMMFENFRDNATNLNGVELLVQTVSSSIVEFDLNVSPVIDEGGSAMVVARGSSSRRNPAVGESSRQRTAYVNEDEAEMRDPDFVSSDIPDTSSEGDLEASGDDTSDDNGIDEGSDDDGTDGGGGHDYDDDDHVGEVGGGDGLPDERLAPFYDQIDMEAQAGPEFPEDVPPTMDNPLFLGAMFDNKDALRQAVKMYSIRQHRDYTVFKSKATFVDYRCKWYKNPCPWRMRARERDYYWEITRYVGPHTCVTPTLTQDNPKMDSTFIASCIVPDVIMTPSIRVSAIIDRIRVMFNTTVKYKKAWRAKHKALGRAFGNWDRSYAIMPRWLKAARHFNPGSVVVWEHMPHPENTDEFCFHRVFWTFAPCIAAFAHLKPILQIDGTFLYGKYTGTLLLAVGQDGNKKVVPLSTMGYRHRALCRTLFKQGECTITLQDVALQLGLPCSGYVVTGTEKHNYRELCMELLGIELPQQRQTRKGQRVSMSWLKSQFQYVPDHNSPEVYKQRYTRQYILHLLGGYLIPDKTSTDCCLMYLPLLRDFAECGQYSWGSAVLGTLYRELCKAANPETEEIAGCLSLLHVWAWDRFPKLAPLRPPPRDPLAHIYQPLPPLAARWQGMLTTARPATSSHHMYRQMIDRMDECGDIDWTPYSSMLERGEIPNEYLQHPDIWRASVPLVNFAIVEWHHSDRVLRKFGMTQSIPGPPRDLSDVHGLSLRNKSHQTWYERHKAWIDIWFQWPALVCTTSVAPTHLDRRSDYMQWYRRHTRKWIHPDSAAQGYAVTPNQCDVADRTMSQVHEQGASHHPFARDVAGGMEHDQFNTPLANPYVPSPPEPSRGPHFCEGGPSNAFQGLCTPRELFGDASQCQSPSFGTLYSDPLVHQQPPPMDFMSTFDPDVSSLWSDVMGPDVNVGQHSTHVAHTGLTFDLNQPPSEEPDQQLESQQFGDSQPCHNQSEDEDPAVPRRTGRRRAPTRCGTGSHYNIH